jgi:hypothetical protein
LFLISSSSTIHAQNAPSPDDAKRAIDQRLQKIWKGLGTKGTRTVLFQQIVAGRGTPGHYPFRATILIHDQEVGYPANHFYGKTCVGRLDQQTYVLSPDEFGGWNVDGAMTPGLSDKTCKDNPGPGQSAIPLSSLGGTPAQAGSSAPAPQRPSAPSESAASQSAVVIGQYECWGNGQARPLLNFSVIGNGQYRDAEGHKGSFQVDANSGRMAFRGGKLDGFLPAGYYAMYHAPHGRPTVSFRNSSGMEVQFCQKN